MDFIELLRREGKQVKKAKGEHVFMQGDADKSLYYVNAGLLKAYYTSSEGKESIKSFLLPKDLIGSLKSVYSEGGCSFGLLCLESTTLTAISFERLLEYSKSDLELAGVFINRLFELAIKKEQREYEFLCLSAEQRYHLLIKNTPALLKKVTQNDLARYLGVTPVGLSRIKKRAYSE